MFKSSKKLPNFVIDVEGSNCNLFDVLDILKFYLSYDEIEFLIKNCTYSCIIARALIVLGPHVTVISRVFKEHENLINFYDFCYRYENKDVEKIHFVEDALPGYILQAYDGTETFLPCDTLFGLKYNFRFMIKKYKKLQQIYVNKLAKYLSIIKTMKKSLPIHIYEQTVDYIMKFYRLYHDEPFKYVYINGELYEPQKVVEQTLS